MKPKNFFALCVIFVAIAVAALATYTKQTARFPRVQIETTFSAGTGTATAVKVDAFVENVLVNDSDANDVLAKGQWKTVSFDLLDPTLTAVNITAAGKTVTYPQLAALIRQAALDRANAVGVN